VFKRIFDGLRRNEFSAGRLDEILLAIGNGKKAVGIEVADVARLEPAVDESVSCFVGTLQ
jgi:hypothetical protein